jgi:hypothetical protein
VDCGFLDCGNGYSCRWFPAFLKNIPPLSSGNKEAVHSSKVLVTTFKIIRRHHPEIYSPQVKLILHILNLSCFDWRA